MENNEKRTHRRRPRYSGKYPRKFNEKYKELNPEKYPDTVKKVILKGSTPAGMHIPIMPKEILDFLDIKEGDRGLDCTLGYGGHTRKFLDALNGTGHLCSLDIDSENIKRTRDILISEGYGKENFDIMNINFKDLDKAAEKYGKFDFILADLGVSSMQIDDPERGFSFKADAELDLRLNQSEGIKASDRLNEMDKEEIIGMLIENSDEPYANEIAEAVIDSRKSGKKINTTYELRALVEEAVDKALLHVEGVKDIEKAEIKKKSLSRTFQALRIDVNHEFEVLYEMLEKLPDVLNEGGRVVILTFHSGEDRIVKKEFKYHLKNGLYSDISRKPIRPSMDERRLNPRSSSSKLRWAIK